MAERLILVAVFAALIAIAIFAVRAFAASRTKHLQTQLPAWDALGDKPDGRPTLIAFSSPSCAACHAAQAPAIDLASQQRGQDQLRVIKIDVASRPHVARAFGVMTVPSTIVIGADGRQIVAVNHGFAPSVRLLEQLARA